jgi:hypothetical protein
MSEPYFVFFNKSTAISIIFFILAEDEKYILSPFVKQSTLNFVVKGDLKNKKKIMTTEGKTFEYIPILIDTNTSLKLSNFCLFNFNDLKNENIENYINNFKNSGSFYNSTKIAAISQLLFDVRKANSIEIKTFNPNFTIDGEKRGDFSMKTIDFRAGDLENVILNLFKIPENDMHDFVRNKKPIIENEVYKPNVNGLNTINIIRKIIIFNL